MLEISCMTTYPILSFHQEVIGCWIPFPINILRNTDSPIMWVDLERWGRVIALESIIKRILHKAIESCIRIRSFNLQDKRLVGKEMEMLALLFSWP